MSGSQYALGTFSDGAGASWPGVVRGGVVIPLLRLLDGAPADLLSLFGGWERWGPRLDAAVRAAPASGWTPESALHVHLPYRPENVYCAGANYRRHVIELIVDKGAGGVAHFDREARRKHGTELMDRRAASGKPFIFVGVRSAIAAANDALVLPHDVKEPDWELELVAVIGRRARRVPRSEALRYVAGYTIGNDITARERVDRPDIPQMGMDWLACKSAPGFKIIGPYVTPASFVPDPQKLHVRLSLNGKIMQDEGTDDMIFNVARLIEFCSEQVELQPGDVLFTGSPSGNGTHYGRFLQDGDEMRGEIDGLVGSHVTRCVAERTT